MKLRIYLLFTLILSLFLSSCETDFDLTADYKDITVVYGLISQNDTMHYLKINKAFLGEGNALEFAKEEDSMSYYNDLEVKIDELKGTEVTNTFYFDTTTITNKDQGIFYYPEQTVYASRYIMPSDNSSKTYRLQITNKKTGKIITAETALIHDFAFSSPRPGQPVIGFNSDFPQKIEWKSAVNGKRYDLSMRFWFEEVHKGSADTISRYVDWSLGAVKSSGILGGQSMELQYQPQGFFTVVNAKIPYKAGDAMSEDQVQSRLVNRMEVIFSVAGDDLNTYMEVNEPSSGIVQDKPDFTNIINGIGLFSSRFTKNTHDSNPPGKFMRVNVPTEERLISGDLKFVKKPGN